MSQNLRILFDTNIVIKLEDDHVIPEHLQKINRLCASYNVQRCIHVRTRDDVLRDKNRKRQLITESKLNKYHLLAFSRRPPPQFLQAIGGNNSDNDNVDNNLLFALNENAVSFLVTEDAGIHKKAQRINIEDRVFSTDEFLSYLEKSFEEASVLSPEIQNEYVGNLNISDSIFDSLKKTYPFEDWVKSTCIPQERSAWVSFLPNRELAAICIFKSEINEENKENELKLCTFKVSEKAQSYMGEYLLFHALSYAHRNNFNAVYLTVYSNLDQFDLTEIEKTRLRMLPSWLESFGFLEDDTNKSEECIYKKYFWPEYTSDITSLGSVNIFRERQVKTQKQRKMSTYVPVYRI